MSQDEIDVRSGNITETMVEERRRRAEAAQAEKSGELAGLLLPLAIAVARHRARQAIAGIAQ